MLLAYTVPLLPHKRNAKLAWEEVMDLLMPQNAKNVHYILLTKLVDHVLITIFLPLRRRVNLVNLHSPEVNAFALIISSMALLVLNAPRLRLQGYALNVMDTHTMVLNAINAHRSFNNHNAHFAQASLLLTLPASPAQFQKPNSYAQPARTTVMYGSVTPALLAYLHSTPPFALLAQAMR
jgi:hypothetical protein